MGGVSRVSHRNITQNPSVIKESNCSMESENEAERNRKTDTKSCANERKTNRAERKRKVIICILYSIYSIGNSEDMKETEYNGEE